MEPCDQNLQHPPRNAKRPPSSDGDDLHTSGVITPQHPPKDPSVINHVQSSSKEGAHVVQEAS
jgi:hypothetical protein